MKTVSARYYIFLFTVFATLTTTVSAGIPPFPVPIITFLSPVSANPGGAGFTLTVTGANFVNGASTVNWNGTPLATTFVSSDQLTATVPEGQIATAGTGWITVSNAACGLCSGIPNQVPHRTSNVFYFPVISSTSSYTAVPLTASVGNSPLGLTGADFNGDGNLDLAVTNVADNTVSILLGNGDGTFQAQQTYPTSQAPFGLAVGDLTGTGVLDVVVGDDSEDGLTILLGDGSGSFTAGTAVTGGFCLSQPVLADFNGDGKLDIAAGSNCGAGVSVFLGNGDGTFGAPAVLTSSSVVWGMALGDFNGDGILDIAAADYGNNTIDIYLGNGDGTFGTANQVTATGSVIALQSGDFNGDGKVDLLCSDQGSGGISVLYGNGDGTFQAPVTVAGAGNAYSYSAAGDMNGDGIVDIVGAATNETQLWLGQGEDSYSSPLTVGSTAFTYGLTLGNFATAGGLDIATVSTAGNQVVVFVPTVIVSPSSENFGSVAVGLSAQQVFTITNDTSNTLTISSVTLAGTNPSNFSQTNTCSSPVATSATCTVTVTFIPPATGIFSAILTVSDDASGSPQTVSLTGSGIAAPIVTLSPATLSFGSQTLGTTSVSQAVTLSNTGNAALSINSVSIAGTNSGDFAQTNNCPGMLNAAAQCTVTVTFTPSVLTGETASLQFSDNAADSPESVALSGTGVNVPPNYSIAANPSSLTITQGQSGSTTLTITQVGGITGTLNFSCTGLPAKTNCVFAPAQVTLSGDDTPATVTLTVNTTGPNGVISQLRPPRFGGGAFNESSFLILPVGFMLLLPVWMKMPKRRTRYASLSLLLMLGTFTMIGMTACGGSSSKATPAGTYSVNAVASLGGTNSQSAVVSVTIVN